MDKKIPRRQFLQMTGMTGLALTGHSLLAGAEGYGVSALYRALDSDRYLSELAVETRITDDKVFTEGPAVDRAGAVYFTNIRMNEILKWDPFDKQLSVFSSTANASNGLRFMMNGDLLACEGGSGMLVRIDVGTGRKTVIADRFNGKSLQAPNDLDFDSNGRVYFSSRTGRPDPEKQNMKSVFRVDPDGRIFQLLTEPQVQMPNGVAVSPDETTLYVIETNSKENGNRKILAFDLHADGTIDNPRTVIDFHPGRSGDGMCVDAEGNLYVAAGLHELRHSAETLDTRPGIHVISPDGELLAYRRTPQDTITNCTFGGDDLKTLYVTAGPYLMSARTSIPGKKSYRPAGGPE
jgi:gluconolactonase